MSTIHKRVYEEEDRLVAELYQMGITYLSNRPTELPAQPRPPGLILADCVRQPDGRVRTAVIGLFLLHPEYAEELPNALDLLDEKQAQLLMLFYTSAVYLQRQYQQKLNLIVKDKWNWLPDRYGPEFGIPPNLSPTDSIRLLGIKHQILSHSMANWSGTYENAALHLIRYKHREQQWNQSLPKSLPNF